MKAERKRLIRSTTESGISPQEKISGGHVWCFRGIFFLFTWWFLGVRYGDFLYFVQEHDLFLWNQDFLTDHLVRPGGLNEWLTSLMIQFFYVPHWGSLIPAFLLTVLTWQTVSFLRLRRDWWPLAAIPTCLLMNAVVYSGYQICEYGFFRFSFGMISGLNIALWIGQMGGRSLWRDLLLTVIGYPLFGSFALFGGILAIVRTLTMWLSGMNEGFPWRGILVRFLVISGTPLWYYMMWYSDQIPFHRIFGIGTEE
ncbi:MAG: DUF6057 family protein, partial [Planctomycetia bacterium]|nr:DUF6057 family protein [Planctomycetia bacterium]